MENKQESQSPQKTGKIEMVVKDGILKVSDLPKVYEEFRKSIPEKGLQESKGAQTGKGYDTLGYGYAWITERLNDVVGPQCWRIIASNTVEKEGSTKNGNICVTVMTDIVVQLGNWEVRSRNKKTITQEGTVIEGEIKEREFVSLVESPVGYGWHKALNIADAKKGAMTNGLKKAAAFFGIGNEAYKKSIDEENQDVKDALSKKRRKVVGTFSAPVSSPTSPTNNLKQINSLLESSGSNTSEEKLLYLKSKFNFEIKSLDRLSAAQEARILALLLKDKQSNGQNKR